MSAWVAQHESLLTQIMCGVVVACGGLLIGIHLYQGGIPWAGMFFVALGVWMFLVERHARHLERMDELRQWEDTITGKEKE